LAWDFDPKGSKFGLSAFGVCALTPWADKHLSESEKQQRFGERFARFLQDELFAHFTLHHNRFCTSSFRI
jgi:hypothetical protein